MRSLWVKIFVWFWLAMIFVGGVLVVAVVLTQPETPSLLSRGRPLDRRWQAFAARVFSRHADRALEILSQEGKSALTRYLEELDKEAGIQANVFDPSAREITGRPVLAGAIRLADRVRLRGSMDFQVVRGGLLLAVNRTNSADQTFTIVGLLPRAFPAGNASLTTLLFRLLVVVMTGGLLCYCLARYLTSPLGKLQQAAQKVAAGDLGARVERKVESRGDEFAELAAEFNQMADRIESLLRSQQQLLSDISHELRSPLARLGVALELARRQSSGQSKASLDRIQTEIDKMDSLIKKVLQLARLEQNREQLPRVRFSLNALVEKVVRDARFEAGNTRSIVLNRAPQTFVTGIEELVGSAVENVIRNALRYTPEGTEVEVSIESEEGTGCGVRVCDQGPGVPDDRLADLFRPFYRAEEARDRASGGVGLGLAITERVVRLHGGQVAARNRRAGGFEVVLWFPHSLQ